MCQLRLFSEPLKKRKPTEIFKDCWLIPDFLPIEQQIDLLNKVRVWGRGLLHTPVLPSGTTMNHPIFCTGWNWEPYQYHAPKIAMPDQLKEIARNAVALSENSKLFDQVWEIHEPDTAIINWFPVNSRLSLHTDNSEDYRLIQIGSPIITVALGCDALMGVGGYQRSDRIETFTMKSGDLMLMFGTSRSRYHEVRKIIPDTAPFELSLKTQGRISVTMRRAQYRNFPITSSRA